MSPSKRAGGTVDSNVGADQPGANGSTNGGAAEPTPPGSNGGTGSNGSNGAGGSNGGNGNGRSNGTRPARTTGNGGAAKTRNGGKGKPRTPPARGSAAAHNASSSSITRRSVTGSFPEDDVESAAQSAAAVAGEALLPAPDTINPTESAVPSADVPTVDTAAGAAEESPDVAAEPPTSSVDAPERTVVPTPFPTAVPPMVPTVGAPTDLLRQPARAPEEPPYVTTSMSSHAVAPVPRLLGRRPRVRRVTRVVRHVDPWSVFKVALVFNLVLYAVLLTAGVLLWNVAYATGTVDNLERFFESFGWSDFQFDGGAMFHAAWIAGLFGVIGLTGAMVLAATLFNLITDLVGGIRMTVLEEEVVERTMAPMRRFVVRRPTGGGIDPEAGLRHESDRLSEPSDPIAGPPR